MEGENLDKALAARLPGIISWLSIETSQTMRDHVYGIIGNPQGWVSQESINHMRYNWLIENGHMDNLTPEQIDEILESDHKEEETDHVMSNAKVFF